MPYEIKVDRGPRPYKIINKQTGKEVGSSVTKAEAERSIGYRESAEKNKRSIRNG